MTIKQIINRYPYYSEDKQGNLVISDNGGVFLRQVFAQQMQTKYARVTPKNIVTGEEAELIGEITQGSVNVDGKSAVRRSCNLTFITNDVKGTITNSSWALKTKFQLDVGVVAPVRLIDQAGVILYQIGDIVWFAMGEFAIQSFNASLNVNSYTISISGQDKMTLLNGTLGGTFPMQVNLSQYEQLNEKGEVVSTHQVPLDEIIINTLLTYGGENFEDIIINGLSKEKASNLLEYRGSTPLYILMDEDGAVQTVTTYGNQKVYTEENTETVIKNLSSYYINKNVKGTKIGLTSDKIQYYCRKVEYGETAGYEPTELIYPGELIGDVGTTVTNALDKIKGVYSTYEYFYDQFGRFIWQKRPNAYKISYPEMNEEGRLKIELAEKLEPFWTFENLEVQTSLSNNAVIQDVKNDFTVWGKKKSTAGELPIHMRVAIQKKPTYYKASDGAEYTTADYDWREIIYQMAKDYNNNRDKSTQDWRTGYEDYYLDMLTFWRQLYDPSNPVQYKPTTGDDKSHGTLYLPYKYEDTDINEESSLNVDAWYCHQVGEDNQSNNYYKWVNSFDVEGYFDSQHSSSPVYGYVKGEVVDLAQVVDLSERGVYYRENEDWKGTPFALLSDRKTETALDGTVAFDWCINNCYYAHRSSLDVKKPIITSSEIQYITGKKTYFNAAGTYKTVAEDDNDAYILNFDYGDNVPDDLPKNGLKWTVWFKDPGQQETEYRRAIAVGIGDRLYTQDSGETYDKIIEVLKAALDEKRTDIYMYGYLKSKQNGSETIHRFSPLTSQAHIKAYYYAETLTEDHIQYYKDDNGDFHFLADHPVAASLVPKRKWHFRKTTTVIRDKLDEDVAGSKSSADRRVITVVGIKDGKTTIRTTTYTPILAQASAPKDSIYYEDKDTMELKLLDYISAYRFDTGETAVKKRVEGYAEADLEKGTWEGIYIDDGRLPIKKNLYTFDWLGNVISTTQSGIVYYYKTQDYESNYWNKRLLLEEPYNRLFWIDFIDPDEGQEVGKSAPWYAQYAKEEIGKRPKAANDSAVTAINYNKTPEIEFNTETFPLSDNFRKYFVVSAQGKTAQEAIDDWLSKYTFCSETVTTNIIPVYILEPNQVIAIKDPNISGIESNYSINSMNIPLGYNGTMSLNLTKIFEYDK